MTRETKIGLLVGLAFIIVVAILLTDHTTSATDPRPAALPDVGANVRQSVAAPAADGAKPDPIKPDALRPADGPRATIPTRADLAAAPTDRVVEPGPGATAPPVTLARNGNGTQGGAAAGGADLPSDATPLPPMGAAPANGKAGGTRGGPLDLVARHPDDLVAVGNADSARGKAGKPAGPAAKTYVAESGDSVSRIASKSMGGNTKANRDALVKANPSLQTDGNPVFAGRSYVIPAAAAGTPTADPAAAAAGAKPVGPAFQPAKPAPAAGVATAWYTVKENDNLWRIAARELGDGNKWTQIKDLNKDVLAGGETVKANMRIRLPKAAPSATASVN